MVIKIINHLIFQTR